MSGWPVQSNVVSVSVIADNCVIADILSTLFFVLGKDKAQEFIEKNRLKGVKGIFYLKQ